MMADGPTNVGRRRLLHAIAVLAAVVLGAFTARVKQHLSARFAAAGQPVEIAARAETAKN